MQIKFRLRLELVSTKEIKKIRKVKEKIFFDLNLINYFYIFI